jgi:hypothetical protein
MAPVYYRLRLISGFSLAGILTTLVLCISFCSSSISSSSSFSSNSTSSPIRNVRFITTIEASENITNYLFRGSLPQLDNKTFAYSELIESMNIALYSSSPPSSLPSSFRLVIVCLLNDLQEYSQIQVEKDFFETHPELGSFIHWPIYGSALNPEDFDSTLRDNMAKGLETWSHDKLPSGMESLQTSLKYPEDLPSVYCESFPFLLLSSHSLLSFLTYPTSPLFSSFTHLTSPLVFFFPFLQTSTVTQEWTEQEKCQGPTTFIISVGLTLKPSTMTITRLKTETSIPGQEMSLIGIVTTFRSRTSYLKEGAVLTLLLLLLFLHLSSKSAIFSITPLDLSCTLSSLRSSHSHSRISHAFRR